MFSRNITFWNRVKREGSTWICLIHGNSLLKGVPYWTRPWTQISDELLLPLWKWWMICSIGTSSKWGGGWNWSLQSPDGVRRETGSLHVFGSEQQTRMAAIRQTRLRMTRLYLSQSQWRSSQDHGPTKVYQNYIFRLTHIYDYTFTKQDCYIKDDETMDATHVLKSGHCTDF